MGEKYRLPRGTKARLEQIKLDLLENTIVYATDTGEIGIKRSDGNIEYFTNADNIYNKSETYSKTEVEAKLGDKVDKVEGKGLSTNDYTTTEKNKLADIASGAEVNIQSDWTQEVNTADDYIKNKPTIPTKVSDLTNDEGYITEYTETDPIFTAWDKSTGISITKSQVSDFSHTHIESDITDLDKYTQAEVDNLLNSKVDSVVGKGLSTNDYTTDEKNKLAGIASGAEVNTVDSVNGQTGVVELDAEDVGALPDDTPLFSGDYDDLSNKPTIDQLLGNLSTLGFVKRTGTNSYVIDTSNYQPLDADLTAIAGLSETSGLLRKTASNTWQLDTSVYLTDITKAQVEAVLTGTITTHTHNASDIVEDASHRFVTDTEKETWNNKVDATHTHTKSEITDFPTTMTPSAHNHDNDYYKKDETYNQDEVNALVAGKLVYKGTFNASGGYPTVSPEKGWFYIVTANGTIGGVDYYVGDWAVYNGYSWDKIENTNAVTSVNGKLGAVILYGNEIEVGGGDTLTIAQHITDLYDELDNRYTKDEVDGLVVEGGVW